MLIRSLKEIGTLISVNINFIYQKMKDQQYEANFY